MLVRRSTVDFRSCNLSGLLAGKLFWNTNADTQMSHVNIRREVDDYRYDDVIIYTLYIERSILRELWSWSNSFTNLSFCEKIKTECVSTVTCRDTQHKLKANIWFCFWPQSLMQRSGLMLTRYWKTVLCERSKRWCWPVMCSWPLAHRDTCTWMTDTQNACTQTHNMTLYRTDV